MSERKRIVVLGSTGSIGRQTLDVVAQHPDKLEVVALAAHGSVDGLLAQARVEANLWLEQLGKLQLMGYYRMM